MSVIRRVSSALLLGVSLVGCVVSPSSAVGTVDAGSGQDVAAAASAEPSKVLQISDISLPRDAKINSDASFVIGTDDRWLGRVVLRSPLSAVDTYRHFFVGMPRTGWTLLSAVQGKVSSLVFSHDARIATVQVEGGALGAGATVTIMVTPRQ